MPESSLPFSPHPPPTSLKAGGESFPQVSTQGMARAGVGGGDRAARKEGESLWVSHPRLHPPFPLCLAAGSVPW